MALAARPIVAAAAALCVLLAAAPAVAGSPDAPAPAVLADLPVPVTDITASDADLGSTHNEVVVISEAGSGGPTVTKLRTRSSSDAKELVAELDARPGVVAAANTRLRAFDVLSDEPLGVDQWNLRTIGAPAAWPTSRGAGVVVAVLDTGVDDTHPDLAGRVLPAIDLVGEGPGTGDPNGHGTAVASLVAAGIDRAGMAGVAPAASILPVIVLDATGDGDSATVARAIVAAADAGARVVNLSLGGPDRDAVLDAACEYAWSKGTVVVAAAGNTFAEGNDVQYPAASPHVVAVASVGRAGSPSYFSNAGSFIDLAAPGEQITAAESGGGYSSEFVGTSFASPQVAGAVAVLSAKYTSLARGRLVDLVKYTAQDDPSGNGRDDQYGYGVLRVDRALSAAGAVVAAHLPAATAVRLLRAKASPEPLRRGHVATVRGYLQARYPDGTWRPDPVPTFVQFQFRRYGSRTWRTIGTGATTTAGIATLRAVRTYSGYWRTRAKRTDGTWTYSRVDYVKVVR